MKKQFYQMRAVAPPLNYLMSISSLVVYVKIKIVSLKLPKNINTIVSSNTFMIITEDEYLEVFV